LLNEELILLLNVIKGRGIRWGWQVACMAAVMGLYTIFGSKISRKRPHGKPGNRWNNDTREIISELPD
jgi:hypothetical protein